MKMVQYANKLVDILDYREILCYSALVKLGDNEKSNHVIPLITLDNLNIQSNTMLVCSMARGMCKYLGLEI